MCWTFKVKLIIKVTFKDEHLSSSFMRLEIGKKQSQIQMFPNFRLKATLNQHYWIAGFQTGQIWSIEAFLHWKGTVLKYCRNCPRSIVPLLFLLSSWMQTASCYIQPECHCKDNYSRLLLWPGHAYLYFPCINMSYFSILSRFITIYPYPVIHLSYRRPERFGSGLDKSCSWSVPGASLHFMLARF